MRRALDLAGTPAMLDRIARARARARAHVWTLIERHARRVPVAGHRREDPGRVAGHRHGRHAGHRPLGQGGSGPDLEERLRLPPAGGVVRRIPASAWPCCCAPATPGRTRSPTTGTCWPRRSARSRPGSGRRILVRVDGAGASHELIKHLLSHVLPAPEGAVHLRLDDHRRRRGRDQAVPAGAWKPGIGQDGTAEEDKDVAEITHLMSRAGNWPGGLRWIVRRVKPSRRQMAQPDRL